MQNLGEKQDSILTFTVQERLVLQKYKNNQNVNPGKLKLATLIQWTYCHFKQV